MSESVPQFANAQDKVNFVNAAIASIQRFNQQGDMFYNQFQFDKAKTSYVDASQLLFTLLNLTKDDAQFQAWLKQQLQYSLSRGETCA